LRTSVVCIEVLTKKGLYYAEIQILTYILIGGIRKMDDKTIIKLAHKPNKDLSISRFFASSGVSRMANLDLDFCFCSYANGTVAAIIDYKQFEFVTDRNINHYNTVALFSINTELPTAVVAYDATDYNYDFYMCKANDAMVNAVQNYKTFCAQKNHSPDLVEVDNLVGRLRPQMPLWLKEKNAYLKDNGRFEFDDNVALKFSALEFLRFGAFLRGVTFDPILSAKYGSPSQIEATLKAHKKATAGTSWDLVGDE